MARTLITEYWNGADFLSWEICNVRKKDTSVSASVLKMGSDRNERTELIDEEVIIMKSTITNSVMAKCGETEARGKGHGEFDKGFAIKFARGYRPNQYILKEFDPDHLESEDNIGKSSITRKYAQFYKKHHYIPRYFNAKNKTEVRDIAPTIATSCGGKEGIGQVLFFYVVEEIAMVINDESLELCEAERIIKKLLRIAEPEEREKAHAMIWKYYDYLMSRENRQTDQRMAVNG